MWKRLRIDSGFFLFVAVLLLTVPIRWILAAFLAALVHELGHYLALRLVGGGLSGAVISPRGARLEAFPMSPGRELLCVLAGPAASLSLLWLIRFFPRIGICGLIQGMYNLLPIYPLDGGRAVGCLASLWRNRRDSAVKGKMSCKESKQRVQ